MQQQMGKDALYSSHERLLPGELKKINRKKVYDYIYAEKMTSKLAITKALELSLPTVAQHLAALLDAGLVENGENMSRPEGARPK